MARRSPRWPFPARRSSFAPAPTFIESARPQTPRSPAPAMRSRRDVRRRSSIAPWQISQVFRGTLAPEAVLAAAGGRPESQFYAHLYLGLYFDALGNKERALEHIRAAAADRYAAVGGYMHTVARIHLGTLQRR